MNYNFKSSFNRSYKKLFRGDQDKVDEAIYHLQDFFTAGRQREGLGLTKIKGDFWEIRASIRMRLLFTLVGDVVSFVIIGNHDDIRKYLKNT